MDPWLGERASGPDPMTEAQLAANRTDPNLDILNRPLDGAWYRERSVDWRKVKVPFLSAANWAGFGVSEPMQTLFEVVGDHIVTDGTQLHPRGNFEAFTQAASSQKWLEAHPGRHEEWFYLEQGIAFQKRFLDHFLKSEANGWDKEAPVQLHIRRPFTTEVQLRPATAWPLPNTDWRPIYLGAHDAAPELSWVPPDKSSSMSFKAMMEPVTFLSGPLFQETEITGPLAAKLLVSSSTTDVDLFVTFQAFSPEGREVEFQGTVDPYADHQVQSCDMRTMC